MDDEIDSIVLRIRADTGAFARDVGEIRRTLDGPLSEGAAAAGSAIENSLGRAVRSGKFGFDDLRRVAVSALSDIAAQAVTGGLGFLGVATGGASSLLSGLTSSVFGLPGRATGGEVVAGRPYLVGERGPEMFVPMGAGRVEAAGGGARTVNITVNVRAEAGADRGFMARSGEQVARSVVQALKRADAR